MLVLPVFAPPTIMTLNVGTTCGARRLLRAVLVAIATEGGVLPLGGRVNDGSGLEDVVYMEAMDGRDWFSWPALEFPFVFIDVVESLRNGR